VGKAEGNRLRERPRPRWGDKTKLDLREVSWMGSDWIDLAQDGNIWSALVNVVINLRVP